MKYYLLFVVLVPLAVAAGVYYSSDHWIPIVFSSWENLDNSTKRELLKVAPTAIAAMFGSIVAAVTAVIVVGLQRGATLQIENRRGEILRELEDKRNTLAGQLEEKKNTLAGQLDTKRQELQHELGLERREIDEKLTRLTEAARAVSEYRHWVQTVRRIGYNKTEEIEAFQKKMIELRDSFVEFPELRQAWANFHQHGFYLCEKMKPLRTIASRREVWAEASQQSPQSLGVEFGNSAEEVLTRLSEARAQVLTVD